MCSLNILIELPKQTVSNTQCLLHTAVQYSLVLIIGIACHIRVYFGTIGECVVEPNANVEKHTIEKYILCLHQRLL